MAAAQHALAHVILKRQGAHRQLFGVLRHRIALRATWAGWGGCGGGGGGGGGRRGIERPQQGFGRGPQFHTPGPGGGGLAAVASSADSRLSAVASTSTPWAVGRLDKIRVPSPKAMRAFARASREVDA